MIDAKIIAPKRTGWKESDSAIRKENPKTEMAEIQKTSAPIWLKTEMKNDDEGGNHCA